MKLIKLLTVGRSLKGAGPVSGHYKVQQVLLPKFSSSVRPSKAATEKMEERLPTLHAAIASHSLPPAELQNDSSPEAMEKTQKIPAGKVLTREPETPEKISEKPKFFSRLAMKVAALKKRLFPPRSKKKASSIPLQAELSLEKVSIVRNDLSDADLEIVTRKAAAKNHARKSHLPDLGRVGSSGVAWVRKTTRLFKATSPFAVSQAQKPDEPAPKRDEKECELAERT